MKGFRPTLVSALSLLGATSALSATTALVQAAARPTATQQTPPTVLSGDVRDANHALVNVTVAVRLFTVTGTGTDLVWSVSHTTDSAGRFSFTAGDFPVADLATKGYPASLVASASGFQAESVAFVVRKVDSLTIRAAPERIPVLLTS